MDGNLDDDDIIVLNGDGERIAKEIKKQHPEIIVIGNPGHFSLKNAHFNCAKDEGVDKFLEVLKNAQLS